LGSDVFLVPSWAQGMGVGKIFSGGIKSGKNSFHPLETKKILFCEKFDMKMSNFKNQGEAKALLPRDIHFKKWIKH